MVALLAGLGIWSVQFLRQWWANRSQEELVQRAMVLEKALVQEHGSGWDPDQSHVVTFALPDGSRRHFTVSETFYQTIHAGDQGELHTRGSWFKGFEKT